MNKKAATFKLLSKSNFQSKNCRPQKVPTGALGPQGPTPLLSIENVRTEN